MPQVRPELVKICAGFVFALLQRLFAHHPCSSSIAKRARVVVAPVIVSTNRNIINLSRREFQVCTLVPAVLQNLSPFRSPHFLLSLFRV